MDEKKPALKDELAKLEKVEVESLTDSDLDSVAGGVAEEIAPEADCNSYWCCSNKTN